MWLRLCMTVFVLSIIAFVYLAIEHNPVVVFIPVIMGYTSMKVCSELDNRLKRKEGEIVFVHMPNGDVNVGVVTKHPLVDGLYHIKCLEGSSAWDNKSIKPFNVGKIGKPWEEL